MGVGLGNIVPKKEIELIELSGKKIAIDAFNNLYQYLTIIRDRITGEPLKDSKGRVTSHLSGLFYRTSNLIEFGIKPVFVFDGPEIPEFKKKTIEAREVAKEEAKKKWEDALEKGEEAITYAQAATYLTDEMIEDSKKLLDAMGFPWIVAKSEGEAQCAFMCKKGSVDATASQDYDSLLFASPRLVRNLSITGKRKLPKKEIYIEIKPEIIELEEVLSSLGITREQLIIVGMLTGTDYNEGIKKVGPKTALKLVKEHKTLKKVLDNVEWKDDVDPESVYEFFLHPPVTEKYKIEFKEPNKEKIIELMTEEHEFSRERVDKVIERLEASSGKEKQSSLKGWFGK
ncbi:flap endonuclease-1 [archaeon]|nr:flap endonuclease-1 [archaeon]